MDKPFITVKEMWEGFAEKCVPKDAGKMQRSEMKVAFFAGCQSFFAAQLALHEAPDDLAVTTMAAWEIELVIFGQHNDVERFT